MKFDLPPWKRVPKQMLVRLSFSRNYVIMVTMFFAVSVINNYALNFNIAMPLHMIFRSVSVYLLFLPREFRWFRLGLISWSLIGPLAGIPDRKHDPGNSHPEKKVGLPPLTTTQIWRWRISSSLFVLTLKVFFSFCRYSASKYLSIALVSVGIFICTIMSAKQVVSPPPNHRQGLNHRPPSVLQCYSIKTTKSSSQCGLLEKPSVLLLIPRPVSLQNTASEGSEERGVHAFMHWLIGELRGRFAGNCNRRSLSTCLSRC